MTLRKSHFTYLFSSVGLIFLIMGFIWFFPEGEMPVWSQKLKGVCWVGSRKPLSGGEFATLKATGANAISQTPFGWQEGTDSPGIRWQVEGDRQWWGESGTGIQVTLDSAESHQISNMLKPHLWVRGSWPGEIEMKSEEDWDQWFENYETFILDYATLAERISIPYLCIGTELEKSSGREEDWRKIIAAVRQVYKGKIVYAANFTEFEHIQFWDALDFIGIQAYFPLSDKEVPTLNHMNQAWKAHLKDIESVVKKFQKPVIFTEIGYCNTHDAAKEPWVWPNERGEAQISEEIQALCYESFFESVWDKTWMAGAYFWKWYPEGKHRDPDFSPQGLKAENVMKQYFLAD